MNRDIAAALLFVLQVADVLSTNAALSAHVGVEANAVMALVQFYYGAWWGTPKLIVTAAAIIALHRRQSPAALYTMLAYYLWIVVGNTLVLCA